jgi:hypothetical protein
VVQGYEESAVVDGDDLYLGVPGSGGKAPTAVTSLFPSSRRGGGRVEGGNNRERDVPFLAMLQSLLKGDCTFIVATFEAEAVAGEMRL